MIEAADTFAKMDRKPALFLKKAFNGQVRALFEVHHARQSEQEEGRFPMFALFSETERKQDALITHPIFYLFISTMRSFVYDANHWSETRYTRAEVRKRPNLSNIERGFRTMESCAGSQRVSSKNAIKFTPRRQFWWDMSHESHVQYAKAKDLGELEVDPLKKGGRTVSSMTTSHVTWSSAKEFV